MLIKKQKKALRINTEETIANILHFPISFSEILILRQIENDVKHILMHRNLKLIREVEITLI